MTARRANGFSLLELMIVVAILGIVTVYMFRSFASNQKAYEVVDQVSEAQQATRAISDLLERDIRHAGFMIPAHAAVCGDDNTDEADALYLSDSNAIEPGGQLSPTFGAGFAGSDIPASEILSVDDVVLDGDPAYDTDGDGVKDSDFQIDAGVIVVDRANPGRGASCGRVEAVNYVANTITVAFVTGDLGPLVGTADLIAVPAHEYRIDTLLLTRNNLALASNVEDLQFAVLIDDNINRVEDGGEYRGISGNPNYDPAEVGMDQTLALEVRVSIVVRTRLEDSDFSDSGQYQLTENRNVAPAGNDGYRRRVMTSAAHLRNVVNRTQS